MPCRSPWSRRGRAPSGSRGVRTSRRERAPPGSRRSATGDVFSPPAPRVKEGGCALPLAARAPLAARVKEGRAPPGVRRERTEPVLSRRGSRRVGALCRLLPGLCCLRRLKNSNFWYFMVFYGFSVFLPNITFALEDRFLRFLGVCISTFSHKNGYRKFQLLKLSRKKLSRVIVVQTVQ